MAMWLAHRAMWNRRGAAYYFSHSKRTEKITEAPRRLQEQDQQNPYLSSAQLYRDVTELFLFRCQRSLSAREAAQRLSNTGELCRQSLLFPAFKPGFFLPVD